MSKVDVIIPSHNSMFIGQAIESVLKQTYQDIHIIIIDDGSTDTTKKITGHYIHDNPDKISYYYQNQAGPASARNTGISNSDGEYIAFLDADDIWLPEKITKQISEFTRKPEIGFVYCDNYFVDKDGKIIDDYVRKVKLVEGDILLDFFMDFFLITSGIILRRRCLEITALFNEELEVGEDFEFFLSLTQHFRAGVVREKLYKRRVWRGSLSKQDYEKNSMIDIQTLKDYIVRNSVFYDKNKIKVKQRFANLYYKFGYMYLQDKKRRKAMNKFYKSLITYPNIKAIKGLINSFINT